MVEEDRVVMRAEELRWVRVMRQVEEKTLTWRNAGALLGLTDRPILRFLRRVEQEGDQGLVGGGANRRTGGSRSRSRRWPHGGCWSKHTLRRW